MMKNDLTELVFILDKSGSMAGLESDTIGGYNSMLKKQQVAEGEAVVTTVIFNHDYGLLHDRINIKGIAPITEKTMKYQGQRRYSTLLDFRFKKSLIYRRKQKRKSVRKMSFLSSPQMVWRIPVRNSMRQK